MSQAEEILQKYKEAARSMGAHELLTVHERVRGIVHGMIEFAFTHEGHSMHAAVRRSISERTSSDALMRTIAAAILDVLCETLKQLEEEDPDKMHKTYLKNLDKVLPQVTLGDPSCV